MSFPLVSLSSWETGANQMLLSFICKKKTSYVDVSLHKHTIPKLSSNVDKEKCGHSALQTVHLKELTSHGALTYVNILFIYGESERAMTPHVSLRDAYAVQCQIRAFSTMSALQHISLKRQQVGNEVESLKSPQIMCTALYPVNFSVTKSAKPMCHGAFRIFQLHHLV